MTTTLPSLDTIPPFASLDFVEPFTESHLDGFRRQGDPLADAVIAEMAAEGPLKGIHDLLGETQRRAAAGSATCQAFLDAVNEVPDWADFEAMEKGHDILAAFPLQHAVSLLAGSLCGGAVFQKMAVIIAMTGQMTGDSSRRFDETGAMVTAMATRGAMKPGARAHDTVVRVRLLHAGLRHYLVDSGRFVHDTDVPINQQDLAITLGLFDYLHIRSLTKLGIRFSRDELASYHLLWRYLGFVIGIDAALDFETFEESQAFFLSSMKHQGRPDKLRPEMKQVLDAFARRYTKPIPPLTGPTQELLHQACRYLSGNDYVVGARFEDLGDDHPGLVGLRALGRVQAFTWHRVPGAATLMTRVGRAAYRAMMPRKPHAGDAYRVRTSKEAAPPRTASPAM